MNMLKVLVDAINGKKTTTGALMILAVYVLQQIGIEKTEATTIATNSMLFIGSAMTAWGYIHKWIKGRKK